LTACYIQENPVDIEICGFDNVHLMRNKNSSAAAHLVAPFLRERRAPQGHGMLLGEYATRSPAPRSTCHAALQILAIPPGIAAVCALPDTPITALASAFNYGF
jgi:hypothetical protein